MNPFYDLLVNPRDVMNEQRYDEDEIPFIASLIQGSQALLYNSGAFDPNNPLTVVVIKLMVGHWLENRDYMSFDVRSIEEFPIGITALVNHLRYYRDDGDFIETS